jgi:hypothetical protein
VNDRKRDMQAMHALYHYGREAERQRILARPDFDGERTRMLQREQWKAERAHIVERRRAQIAAGHMQPPRMSFDDVLRYVVGIIRR